MKQIWYSESLKKYFDDQEACEKAEKEFEEKHALELKKKEEKTAKAKEIEEAYKHYLELRDEFVKTYGAWHMTLTDRDLGGISIFDLFDPFKF